MTAILFATLVWQVTDLIREALGGRGSRSSLVTQLAAFVVGIVFVWIGANATVTQALVIPGVDTPLGDLDGGSIVLVGLLVASLASSLVDVKAAIDNTDSARKPPLPIG